MKISFITQWYDPEVGSAAIPGSIVRALRARGHDVEVVTGFPNYPTGQLYSGYRVRPYKREDLRGVKVHRVPLYVSHDDSALRRMANFISFMVSASSLGAWLVRRADVVLVYSTPATVGAAGWVLKKIFRRPFVLYIQDVWPDTVTASGMLPDRFARPTNWLLHKFCDAVYRSAKHIAVISPGMKDLLVTRGVPPEKVSVVFNWIDEEVFHPVAAREDPNHEFDIMYAGNLGEVQGLDTAVRALAFARREADVTLRLVGAGVAEKSLRALAKDLHVAEHVHFEGTRTLAEMAQTLATADVQLVCLKDDPLFHLTMPSKIQAILACGKPLITSAPGDAARLTEESGSGWSAPAGDAKALAELFVRASRLGRENLERLGAAGRRYYEERLSAQVGVAGLERALVSARLEGAHA